MNAEHKRQEQRKAKQPEVALSEAAVHYARMGWSVFPLHEKLPYKGTHGHKDATTDLAAIHALWSEHPIANIGLATGAVSGVIVLDIDPRHDGYFSFKEIEKRYGKLPDTKTSRTANGGLHKFFQHPQDGKTYPNAVQLNGWKGIDVRGDGGYVVLPPSKLYHRLSYLWAKTDHPLAPLPAWLQELLPVQQKDLVSPQPMGFAQASNHWIDEALRRAVQGSRDNTGFWLACQLRDDGLSQAEAATILRNYAAQIPQGDHPYTEQDAMRNVSSAYSRPPRERARRK